jgi:uncharacterized protein (TIGR02466 family)
MNEVRITRPLVFEDTFNFNKGALIPKFEELSKGPNFNWSADPLMNGSAGTSAIPSVQNGITHVNDNSTHPHNWPELSQFVNWVLDKADKIFKEWKFEYGGIEITKSWINKHQQGGWTNSHYHHYNDLALVAYIQAPENSGNLLMTDPMEYHWMGFRSYINAEILMGSSIPVRDNKVVFFAPFIRHGTEKNHSNIDRWALSMNIRTIPIKK